MCQYITILVPKAAAAGVYNLHGDPLLIYENDLLLKQVPRGMILGRATNNVCDCGSFYAFEPTKIKQVKVEDIEQLVKKDWSAQKIERYKADKQKSIQKNMDQKYKDTKEWFDYFAKILSSPKLNYFGFLTHFYDHSVETENIKLQETVKTRFADINATYLELIEYDKLYIFSK